MADWLGLQAIAEEYRQQQAKEAWQKAHPNVPPLPPHMPQAEPVAAIKNETVYKNHYTPEAAKQLFNTPMRADFLTPRDSIKNSGYYVADTRLNLPMERPPINPLAPRPNPQIVLSSFNGWNAGDYSPSGVLAHEFAHLWEDQNLPRSRAIEWNRKWKQDATAFAVDQAQGRMDVSNNEGRAAEAYAHQAQGGPLTMPPETRGYYYPGLYQDNLGPERKPPPFVSPDVPTPYTARVIPYAPPEAKDAFRGVVPSNFDLEAVIRDRQLPGPWQWRGVSQPPPVFVYPWGKEVPPSLKNIDLFDFSRDSKGG